MRAVQRHAHLVETEFPTHCRSAGVRHLDTKEIRDLFHMRAALESLAARELATLPERADAVAALHRQPPRGPADTSPSCCS